MNDCVLITGASTGIGYASAELLASEGYAVIAGVRSRADAERLQALHQNVHPAMLDVTREGDLEAAVHIIAERGLALRAIVNNAGIAVAGPLEYLPMNRLRRQFDVNVFGALSMTQAALPLLRKSCGRVVFISSVSGQIAPPLLGPYAASKFAIEALADALRMELAPFGIFVIVLQPGNVRTPIWQKGRAEKDRAMANFSEQARERYGAAIENLARVTVREERSGIAPAVVARAVLKAIRTPRPHARYAVGAPAAWQRKIAMMLPERLRDRLVIAGMSGD